MSRKAKTALIFGGSGGMGQAIAKEISLGGFNVFVADRKKPEGRAIGHFIPTDATAESDVKRAILYVEKEFGSLDVVINCQGIYLVDSIEEIDESEWDRVLSVNLKSVFLVCKNVLPLMKWRKGGYIVNIASMSGLEGKRGHTVYAASKFGVVGLTESLFEELKGTGVRITAICPASVDTDFLHNQVRLSALEKEKLLAPGDIARVVTELITSSDRIRRKTIPIEIDLDIDKLARKKF